MRQNQRKKYSGGEDLRTFTSSLGKRRVVASNGIALDRTSIITAAECLVSGLGQVVLSQVVVDVGAVLALREGFRGRFGEVVIDVRFGRSSLDLLVAPDLLVTSVEALVGRLVEIVLLQSLVNLGGRPASLPSIVGT